LATRADPTMPPAPVTFSTMTGRPSKSDRCVPVEGAELRCLELPIVELFFRSLEFREFDASEISFAKYVAMLAHGEDWLTAIPVFPTRVFRHSSIYVRRDGPVKQPADLVGRRVGVPEWAQTAQVYVRGALQHQYGIDLASIDWVQAGVNESGRLEKVQLSLPPGLKLKPMPEKNLSDMLVAGEIDAAMTAAPPSCFLKGHPNIGRLFDNHMAVERAYFLDTGIFPIMHTVVIRTEVLERNPWLATSLFTAFDEARRRSVERAMDMGMSRFPLPWVSDLARQAKEMLGGELWPYGIEANRKTLEAFLQYAYEQGVCSRRLDVQDIFAKNVQRRASF
jgi:4,5-dihydroxyphthalate decarboxylase